EPLFGWYHRRPRVEDREYPRLFAARNGPDSASENIGALAEVAEDLLEQTILVRVGGRRSAADEVEHLAVLQTVLGNPFDGTGAREVDRDDAPVHLLGRQKRDLLGRARDVVEGIARPDGARRGRRAEHHPDLLLSHARLDLLQVRWLEGMPVLRDDGCGAACRKDRGQ